MHIVHIIESFAAGSLTALSTLCTHVQGGIQHSVVYSLRSETPTLFQQDFPPATHFYPLAMQRNVHPVGDIRAWYALVRLIRQLQPDLVHCHSSKAGVLGRLAALYTGIPCAYTPHGYAFLHTDLPNMLKKCYWAVERCMAALGQHTIACGEEEYQIAQSLYPRNTRRNRVHLVKNSITLSPQDSPEGGTASASEQEKNAPLTGGYCGQVSPPARPPALRHHCLRPAT